MRTALVLAATLASVPLRAQTPPPPTETAPPQVPEAPPVRPADPAPAEPAEKKPAASAGADGFVIQSDGGDYRLQLRGYSQFDGRFYPGVDAILAADQFLMRRVRPILQGTIAKNFEFAIAPDFGAGTTALLDAYLDVRHSPKARVRVGKFKPPLGLERLQSATNLSFVERALPTGLVPNRDLGAQLFGDLGGGVVSYAVGVFNGVPDGANGDLDTNDGKDVVGRVFVSPFKRGSSALKELGFGVAGSVGRQTGNLPTYRSGGQLPIVVYAAGVTADGTRRRLVPQLSFYRGPVGLLAEYAQADAFVRKAVDGQRTEVRTRAWQATATWTLTGEPASYAGVRPQSPFEPAQGHWGAFELAARVNGFEIDDEVIRADLVDPTRSVRDAFAWAVGLNWYLSRNVKQVLSYERTSFSGGASGGGDRDDENALFLRTQLSF